MALLIAFMLAHVMQIDAYRIAAGAAGERDAPKGVAALASNVRAWR
jgi:hypothetical protein